MIEFYLPFPPSVNTKYKVSRGKRVKGDKVKEWEFLATDILNKQCILPVAERCFIVYEMHHPDDRERDTANYEKYTTDFLVHQGILQGDHRPYVKSIVSYWNDKPGKTINVRIYPASEFPF